MIATIGEIVTVLGALAAALVTIAAAIVAALNSWRANRKADEIVSVQREIHVLVNSKFTAALAEIEALKERIEKLTETSK